MRKSRIGSPGRWGEEARPACQACDHPDCIEAGEYRAPKGRARLNEYYWFCLNHVREYNKAWDYYAGMGPEQIEAHIRFDTTWQMPTWPMGSWRAEKLLRDRLKKDFDVGAENAKGPRTDEQPYKPRTAEDEAFRVLDLSPPVEFGQIKARYRELVKLHHPDANGGDKDAEDKLKTINLAYTTLKAAYGGKAA